MDWAGEGARLELTGQTVRRKFFLDIYDLAHYRVPVEESGNNSSVFGGILSGSTPQQITMVFRRGLKSSQIQDALSDGVEANCNDGEFEAVSADLAAFREAIDQNVAENDRFVMQWLPSGRLVSMYQGETISDLNSPLLARLLWTMWFGEQSVVDRDALVERLIRAQ